MESTREAAPAQPPPRSAGVVLGAAFFGTILLVVGLAVVALAPILEWRDDRSSFDPVSGSWSRPGSGGDVSEWPPLDTRSELVSHPIAPDDWLYWEGDAEVPTHYRTRRVLPPSPGLRCAHTLAGEQRFGVVCEDESGVPSAYVEGASGWTRLADPGPLLAFVRGDARPAATPAGLVGASGRSVYVWRPGERVREHVAPGGEQRIYGLVIEPRGTVLVTARVHAISPSLALLKLGAALAVIAGLVLLREALRPPRRTGLVIAAVIAALVAAAVVAYAAAIVLVAQAGGLRR